MGLVKSKKGQTALAGIAITILITSVVLYISPLILGEFTSAINESEYNTDTQDTMDSVKSTSYSGMDLLVVGLIILAAVGIIGIVYRLRGR